MSKDSIARNSVARDSMAGDTQDKLCEGYLITGDQKNVNGGFTVDFQKQNKFYFVLWKNGQHIYNLEGFKDEKAFTGKRKSSLNPFGGRKKSISSSSVPSFILTSTVKVHCMDMTIGKKKNHVIILIHAKIPYYFKTQKESEIKPWYKAFSSVSTDMESRNDRTSHEEVVLRRSPGLKHINHQSKDSGRGSTSSSTRSSQDSSGSRLSDIINSCPPSPSFIPTNIMVEIDPEAEYEDYMDMDQAQPAPSGMLARRKLTKSVIYGRRERKDSCDESVRKFDFAEVSGQTYDTVIRTSIVIDDTDAPPVLPQKTRVRRGSEPNLQIPNTFHHRPENPQRSPELGPAMRRERSASQASSPPPLPARPNTYFAQPIHTPDYVNVSRKPSVPANMSLTSLASIYEPAPTPEENIERLIWEQTKDMDGVVVEFSKAELLDSLVLTTIKDEVWVASWKKDLNNELYGKLHVGDKLRQINTQTVRSGELAMEFIRTTSGDKIQVTLSRLPYAVLRNLSRSNPSIHWGIHLKSNTEIKSLTDGPVLTEDQGLTPKAKCVYSGKTCDWVITEINRQRVPLIKNGRNQDLVKNELEADHRELPLIVQPHDFIKKLSEAIEKRRSSSQFY